MCTPILAGVFSLVGSVVQGIGASQAAKQQAEADAANQRAAADNQRRQAAIAQTTGAYKAQRRQDEIDRALGAQRAAYAGSGVALTGTPELVIAESATEGALDLAAIRWSTRAEAEGGRHNAINYERSADNTIAAGKTNARNAFIAPVIGGVAKFAGSFG